MDDVAMERITEVEHIIHDRHPEMAIGAFGWAVDASGS
jgi:hypothetical protein